MNKDVHFYRETGFTLIELLFSLLIFFIIAALAIPSLSAAIEKSSIRAHTSALYHLLVYARTESVYSNSPVTICPTDSDTQCLKTKDWSEKELLVFHDKNWNGEIDDEERILKSFKAGSEGSKLIWRSFRNKSYLTFTSIGMTDYQSGNITYCPPSLDLKKAKILVMNIAGRPYYGQDTNGDKIAENGSGTNLSCSL